MRLVLATLLSLVLAAVTLSGAAMSIPDLGELATSDPQQDIDYPFPASSSVRLPRWAIAVGVAPSWSFWVFDRATGMPSDLPDCREKTLPPCPRELRAYSVEQVLRSIRSDGTSTMPADEDLVVVDGRLDTDGQGRSSLFPLRVRRGVTSNLALDLRPVDDSYCGRHADGQRVLVEGIPDGDQLYFRRICAVIPGVEPSQR
jgi:hypothetical protein